MDIQTYGDRQARIIKDSGSLKLNLAHMAMGVSGEAGEILDDVKKHFAYDKAIDRGHILEEVGDVVFYLNGLIRLLDATWGEVLEMNVAKLSVRYPKGTFDADNAINRDTNAEQEAMSGASA